MFPVRFLSRLVAAGLSFALLAAATPLQAQQPTRKKPSPSPTPYSRYPAAPYQSSEALRYPARRPPPPPRPDTVSLPFSLIWGDTQNKLASLFAGAEAKVTNKKIDGPNEVWTVQGLIAPNLTASLFTFQSGQLAAMEFDYGQPDWDLAKYNEAMGQFRRLLEAKCEAPGEMITRETDQPGSDGVKQSLMGYQWKRGDTSVQLFYFSAEDPAKAQAFRSISVHYHYQDPAPPESVDLPASNPNADPNLSPLFGGRAKPASADTPPPATPPPEPATSPDPAASPSLEAAANAALSPGESPAAASPGENPTVSPTASPAPSPTATPKGSRRKSKPTPTPEGESLPLPEQ